MTESLPSPSTTVPFRSESRPGTDHERDDRRFWATGWMLLSAPLVLALTVAAGLPCPFSTLFGIDCPGCGATRATRSLLQGDLVAALDHNALVVAAVPILVLLVIVRRHRPTRLGAGPGRVIVLGMTILVWTAARNTETFSWFGSGL